MARCGITGWGNKPWQPRALAASGFEAMTPRCPFQLRGRSTCMLSIVFDRSVVDDHVACFVEQ